jgi:hypothetical protein
MEKKVPSKAFLLLVSATPVGVVSLLGDATMDPLFSFLRC